MTLASSEFFKWSMAFMALSGLDIIFTAWGLSNGGHELNPVADLLWLHYSVAGLVIAKAIAIVITVGVGVYLKTRFPVIMGVMVQGAAVLVPLISLSL